VHGAAIGTALFLPLFTVATILLVGAAMTPALELTAWMDDRGSLCHRRRLALRHRGDRRPRSRVLDA
jgi:hypothetical protein